MTFREKVESAVEPQVEVKPVSATPITSDVEVPYLDYESQHGKPYLADLYELGSYWNDRTNGFIDEVSAIEGYLQRQVTDGEINNSLKGVKTRLKEIEKITNMDKESRQVIKMEVMAEYVKFLEKTKDIKHMIKRYGNN